jgi:predicted lipid-binding transport protein (Tim44 family)
MSRRRALLIGLGALALALALAPEALASAGGGTSGFSGGGGGKGFALYILLRVLIQIALLGHGLGALALVALVLAYLLFTRVLPGARAAFAAGRERGFSGARSSARRQRRVELAAAEAAEEDPAFAPDAVRGAAAELFCRIQRAWSRADRIALRGLVAPGLLAEWERRLDVFESRGWRNLVEVLEPPRVAYVALRRPASEADGGQVVVRVDARLRDYVIDAAGRRLKRIGRATETVRSREFWRLARRADHWILAGIEQGAEGAHALSERIIADPSSDQQALRDEALLEGAAQDAVPDGTSIGELVALDYEGDARAAALDLSLADGRFAPDVLEVAARRAVDAWSRAVDGDERALRAIATPAAVSELLHPGDPSERTKLVVRGARVRGIRMHALDPHGKPPTLTVDVELSGRRYLQDRDTAAVLTGSQAREQRFTERFTMALSDDPGQPWRLVRAAAAVPPS